MSTEGVPGPMAPSPHPHVAAFLAWVGGGKKNPKPVTPKRKNPRPSNPRPLGTPPEKSR